MRTRSRTRLKQNLVKMTPTRGEGKELCREVYPGTFEDRPDISIHRGDMANKTVGVISLGTKAQQKKNEKVWLSRH